MSTFLTPWSISINISTISLIHVSWSTFLTPCVKNVTWKSFWSLTLIKGRAKCDVKFPNIKCFLGVKIMLNVHFDLKRVLTAINLSWYTGSGSANVFFILLCSCSHFKEVSKAPEYLFGISRFYLDFNLKSKICWLQQSSTVFNYSSVFKWSSAWFTIYDNCSLK